MARLSTAKLWREIHQSERWQYPSANAQAFLRYHVKSPGCILDHGCGYGRHSFLFNNAGLNVYAIDASKSALEAIRSLDVPRNEIKTELADYTSLPFKDDKFDYIFSEAVLYYGDEQSFISGVNEIHRCLRPNGIARIYTKTDKDYWVTHGKPLGNDTYLAKNHPYENNMLIYCAPIKKIIEHMRKFTNVTIGIEEFNYVDLDSRKSFWVITATK